MYVVGNEITITWVLAPTASPLSANAYDIRFVPSDLDGTYIDGAIVNYVAPSEFYAGSLQYLFTPAVKGRYQIYLTTGAAAAYQILDKKNLWVFAVAPDSDASLEALGASSNVGVGQ